MQIILTLLLALVATHQTILAGPLPPNFVVLALWPNGNCKGAPAIAFPLEIDPGVTSECGDVGFPLIVKKNGVVVINEAPFVGMTCDGAIRRYSYGETGCTNNLPTKDNFEEYCITTSADLGLGFPISARLLCGDAQNPATCGPRMGENKAQCKRKSNRCLGSAQVMKWTARGCRRNGITGTGGCQCVGYCGYNCPGACIRDSECYWNGTSNTCYNKPTILFDAFPGGPMPECPLGGLLPFVSVLDRQPRGIRDSVYEFILGVAGVVGGN